jgi:hypothetical protein
LYYSTPITDFEDSRIIIDERALPDAEKTVKKAAAGGVAGGDKYIVRGSILFKFAVDSMVSVGGGKKMPLYGGDEFAAKAASHDLKGLTAYFNADVRGLRVPLMAIIDYRGVRLQAISLLPISNRTLVFGSSDGAKTVHKSDSEMNRLMLSAAQRLNLKEHLVGRSGRPDETPVALCAPADIEGHRVGNQFYLLDFARTAPPEAVPLGAPPASFLFRLLRMEFVKSYHVPLSSDAFSPMGRDNELCNPGTNFSFVASLTRAIIDIVAATQYLFAHTIPTFAAHFVRHVDIKLNRSSDARDVDSDSELDHLSARFHAAGINVRHLGRVRAAAAIGPPDLMSPFTSAQFARQTLLIDALARVTKVRLLKIVDVREVLSRISVKYDISGEKSRRPLFPRRIDSQRLLWMSATNC